MWKACQADNLCVLVNFINKETTKTNVINSIRVHRIFIETYNKSNFSLSKKFTEQIRYDRMSFEYFTVFYRTKKRNANKSPES